jgi:hypothetical protein
MINPNGLLPLPVVATYNPLARQPDEEEQARLEELPLPPVDEAAAAAAGNDRRRSPVDAQTLRAEGEPGRLIDSYA